MLKIIERIIEAFIFASRWIQLPIYLGLIVATGLYGYKFVEELVHMISHIGESSSTAVMIYVLDLIDISMVINLLIVVIIGGYSTFVSKINLTHHEDKPEWLGKMDAGSLKIKLIVSLVSVSGVHLLKSFIEISEHKSDAVEMETIILQIAIHIVFIVSAILLAWADRIHHEKHAEKV